VTTIINPTLTNEFVFGSSRNDLHIRPVDDTWNRDKLGLAYKMPYPSADTLGLVQNWRFGGVPNGPFTAFNGTPFLNFNHTMDFTDSVAKVAGAHTIKAGLYMHRSAKDQTAFTSVNGTSGSIVTQTTRVTRIGRSPTRRWGPTNACNNPTRC
jgi:hypothetical protein